jgi:hypothetical protein
VRRVALGLGAALAAALMAAVAWPGAGPPTAVTIGTFMLAGVAGATSMTAFGVARAGSPARDAGAASGLVNLGGFSAAIAGDAAIALTLALPLGEALGYRAGLAAVALLIAAGLAGIRREGAALLGGTLGDSGLERARGGDLDAAKRLGDGALRRRLRDRTLERGSVDAGHATAHLDPHSADRGAFVAGAEGALGRHPEALRRMPVARQPVREGHAQTGRLRRRDQLLGRRAGRVLAGPASPGDGERGRRPAVEPHLAGPVEEPPLPDR